MKKLMIMKKPAAARPKMKKRSACIKRPSSGCGVNPAARSKAYRDRKKLQITAAEGQQKRNVRYQARQAASKGKSYQTKSPKLAEMAAAAYTEAAYARKRADCAHEGARKAHAAADSAREAADKAQEDAGDARMIALETDKRITSLEGEVRQGQILAAQHHLKTQERFISLAGQVKSTTALANHNRDRLDTDDRKRGYVTPDKRLSSIY